VDEVEMEMEMERNEDEDIRGRMAWMGVWPSSERFRKKTDRG